MASGQQSPMHFLLVFVIVFVAFPASEALGFKAGKDNITTVTPGLFACKKIFFPIPFNGGGQVKVLASVGHTTKSQNPRNGGAVWVEDVKASEFTACVVEFGEGSNTSSEIQWFAFESSPPNSQTGTTSLNTWTTGTECKKIDFQQRFSSLPTILVTASHQLPKRPQDAMVVWVEELRQDGFKVCLREIKIFDGPHQNLKINWMAFTNLSVDNFTLFDSLVFTNTNSPSHQNNYAFCQTLNFTEPFYAPPVVIVTPKHSDKNNKSNLSGSRCNAVTAWVEHTSTTEAQVCVKNYNCDANSKDIITVDYLITGDLDPCIDVTCHYHCLCKAFGPRDARCVSEDSCPSYQEPVCSSNGTTYDNECLFRQEMCLLRLNFTVQHPGSCEGFPFQRGRRHMPHIPSLGYSHCEVVTLKPYVFYPDKPLEVQVTVNHIDTGDKSYVHDAAVSWVENVNYNRFTACVMAAGFNERKSEANITVDWMAYQGAPVGGIAGEVRISQWWTGTTCKDVNSPSGKFSVLPSVFVTAVHHHAGLKRDAASVWIEDVTLSSFKVCLRELQNYAGSHEDVYVKWLAFSTLHKPLFTEHNSVYFGNSQHPPADYNNAFCKDFQFTTSHNNTPNVFVSANHSSNGGNLNPIHNGITAWVEYINKTGFRVCLKELYETKYDPLSISYAILSDICRPEWSFFGGYCYFTSHTCASWLTAESNCTAMNSDLVTVHNQEENVYIQHRHNGERSWVGLNDRSVEGSFVWTNKEISKFRYWAPKQPNDWNNEDCVHTLGAKHGFTWNDVPCSNCFNYTCFTDIDECSSNSHSCDVNAVCTNTPGSYTCTCKAGFTGNGESCTDIDECSSNSHSCDVNAVCTNTYGSYSCTCKAGYSGDGKSCVELCGTIKAVGNPVTHHTRSIKYGAWMKDPLGIMGNETIFVMKDHYGQNLEEFENMNKFKAGVTRKTYILPYRWGGTGGVVYGHYLYYSRINKPSSIVKYNLQTGTEEAQIPLSDYSQTTNQWGGYSGADLAVDEQGLWALWGSSVNNKKLKAAKIDVNGNRITKTWTLNTEPRSQMGNSFVACGVVYCIDDYSASPTTINFAYDTWTGKQWNPNIRFINEYGYNSMVDYNPREKVLYSWDNKRQVTYSLTFT